MIAMKHGLFAAGAVALALGLGACAGATSTQDVCGAVAAVGADPVVMAYLEAQPPTSAIGVLWADVGAACKSGTLASGVNQNWAQQVLTDLVALVPSLLPLIGAL